MVLDRSWTPAILAKIVHRIDPDPRVSAAVVYRGQVLPGNPKGWWLVLTDPRLTPRSALALNSEVALRDLWTAELVGSLYQDRRQPSAVSLSGVAIAARPSEFGNGENSGSLFSASTYAQAEPAALRTRVQQRAAVLGLKIRSFRMPALDGILAPVVVLQVSDLATFKRWYDPGCAEVWLFGWRPGPNGSLYWGFFLTVVDSSRDWLYVMAATPNEGSSAASPRLRQLIPPPAGTPGVGGLRGCPARFAQ